MSIGTSDPFIKLLSEDEARLILGYINLSESEGIFSVDYNKGEPDRWNAAEESLLSKLRKAYPDICREYKK